MRRLIGSILVFVLTAFALPLYGQSVERVDTLELDVYYWRGYSTWNGEYRENGVHLDAFIENIRATHRLLSLRIVGSTSPEGRTDHNKRLAVQRAKSLGDYFQKQLDCENSLLEIHSNGEDWAGLTALVGASDMPYREEVLQIIENTPEWITRNGVIVDGRKRQLMNLNGGRAWRTMCEQIFPQMRRCAVQAIFEIGSRECAAELGGEHSLTADSAAVKPLVDDSPVLVQPQPAAAPTEVMQEVQVEPVQAALDDPTFPSDVSALLDEPLRKPVVALRTNMLLPLLNFGMEVPVGNRWSIGADYYYPWLWRKDDHKDCFQLLFWSLEGRYWFGKRHRPDAENFRHRLTGHSVGLYAAAGYYDIERNYAGHQGTCYSAGVDYLYALPVAKGKVHFEFSIAVGYLYSDAQAYRVREEGGRLLRKPYVTNRIQYFGPTKATVSLVIPIGKTVKR